VAVDPADPAGPVDLRVAGWRGTQAWAGTLDLGPDHVAAVASVPPAPELRVVELSPDLATGVWTTATTPSRRGLPSQKGPLHPGVGLRRVPERRAPDLGPRG
jgi:hypothetical protein